MPLPRMLSGQSMRLGVLALFLWFGSAAWAHPDADDTLAALNREAPPASCDASAELRRGDLERRRQNWSAAATAYDLAQLCAPDLDVVELHRAALHLDTSAPERALVVLAPYVDRHPDSARAHELRARALAQLHRPREAIEDYAKAVAKDPTLQPDLILSLAKLQVSNGQTNDAVITLDNGLTHLGAVPALLHLATHLDRAAGRYDNALKRLDRFGATLQHQQVWLVERGEILLALGRAADARVALQAALAPLSAEGRAYRPSAKRRDLTDRARHALQQIETASADHTSADSRLP